MNYEWKHAKWSVNGNYCQLFVTFYYQHQQFELILYFSSRKKKLKHRWTEKTPTLWSCAQHFGAKCSFKQISSKNEYTIRNCEHTSWLKLCKHFYFIISHYLCALHLQSYQNIVLKTLKFMILLIRFVHGHKSALASSKNRIFNKIGQIDLFTIYWWVCECVSVRTT